MKKYIALTLIALLLHTAGTLPVRAKSNAERAVKAKASIRKFGTGENAKVKIQLADGSKLEGYISEAGEDGFVLTNAKTNTSTTISYPQVGQVKRNNLSKGAWITIGVVAAVGVIVGLTLLTRCRNEGGCG